MSPTEAGPSQFFPLADNPDDPPSMKISLPGVLDRAAEACRADGDLSLVHSLGQLKQHINAMREARNDHEAADLLSQFLKLWVNR